MMINNKVKNLIKENDKKKKKKDLMKLGGQLAALGAAGVGGAALYNKAKSGDINIPGISQTNKIDNTEQPKVNTDTPVNPVKYLNVNKNKSTPAGDFVASLVPGLPFPYADHSDVVPFGPYADHSDVKPFGPYADHSDVKPFGPYADHSDVKPFGPYRQKDPNKKPSMPYADHSDVKPFGPYRQKDPNKKPSMPYRTKEKVDVQGESYMDMSKLIITEKKKKSFLKKALGLAALGGLGYLGHKAYKAGKFDKFLDYYKKKPSDTEKPITQLLPKKDTPAGTFTPGMNEPTNLFASYEPELEETTRAMRYAAMRGDKLAKDYQTNMEKMQKKMDREREEFEKKRLKQQKKAQKAAQREGFAGALAKEDRKGFDNMRRKQSEVLGYKLTGKSDIRTEIDDATIKETMSRVEHFLLKEAPASPPKGKVDMTGFKKSAEKALPPKLKLDKPISQKELQTRMNKIPVGLPRDDKGRIKIKPLTSSDSIKKSISSRQMKKIGKE
jgi:hypothetical protein